jgi:hypothetical protein
MLSLTPRTTNRTHHFWPKRIHYGFAALAAAETGLDWRGWHRSATSPLAERVRLPRTRRFGRDVRAFVGQEIRNRLIGAGSAMCEYVVIGI